MILATDRVESIEEAIEWVGIGFDVVGVGAIVVGTVLATVRFIYHYMTLAHDGFPFQRYKVDLGLSILLGLEILVAADIIKTVAFAPTFENLGVLSLLVAIRTFLSWAIVLEIEGRWPWQPREGSDQGRVALTMGGYGAARIAARNVSDEAE